MFPLRSNFYVKCLIRWQSGTLGAPTCRSQSQGVACGTLRHILCDGSGLPRFPCAIRGHFTRWNPSYSLSVRKHVWHLHWFIRKKQKQSTLTESVKVSPIYKCIDKTRITEMLALTMPICRRCLPRITVWRIPRTRRTKIFPNLARKVSTCASQM